MERGDKGTMQRMTNPGDRLSEEEIRSGGKSKAGDDSAREG